LKYREIALDFMVMPRSCSSSRLSRYRSCHNTTTKAIPDTRDASFNYFMDQL